MEQVCWIPGEEGDLGWCSGDNDGSSGHIGAEFVLGSDPAGHCDTGCRGIGRDSRVDGTGCEASIFKEVKLSVVTVFCCGVCCSDNCEEGDYEKTTHGWFLIGEANIE